MPKQIKGEDGAEETVYSQAELDAQHDAAIEKYKEEHPEDSAILTERDELKTKLEEAERLLAGSGDKTYNFKKLEQEKTELAAKLANIDKTIDERVNAVRNEFTANALETAVSSLAGDDQELAKKLKFHFEKTLAAVQPKTPAEFKKKVQDAYMLAAGKAAEESAMNTAVIGSGSGGGMPGGGSGGGNSNASKDVAPEVKAMGLKHFGITDDDWKKYDRRDFSTTK